MGVSGFIITKFHLVSSETVGLRLKLTYLFTSVVFIPVHSIWDIIQIPASGINDSQTLRCDTFYVSCISHPNLNYRIWFHLKICEKLLLLLFLIFSFLSVNCSTDCVKSINDTHSNPIINNFLPRDVARSWFTVLSCCWNDI